MKFTVYIVGEKLEKFYYEAIKEYEKRLGRYCKIAWFHVKKETMLQKMLDESSYKILISTTGKSVSSEELALKIDHMGTAGISNLSIILGTTLTSCEEILSLSQMEMGFGLNAVVLFEQIYRAYRINHNHPYHK